MPPVSFLDSACLQEALGEYAPALAVHLYDTIDSTNTAAKAAASNEKGPALYIARTQTGGRGRLGRSFHSPADTGLYMTVCQSRGCGYLEAVVQASCQSREHARVFESGEIKYEKGVKTHSGF